MPSHIYDAVVIGAGVAGLTAGDTLAQAGIDVLVLEAKDYPGGRINTIHYGDLYAESGAMVITGDEKETLGLLSDLSLDSLFTLGPHGVELFFGKRMIRLTRIDGNIESVADLISLLQMMLAGLHRGDKRIPFLGPGLFLAYRRALRKIQDECRHITFPYNPDARPNWDTSTFAEFLDGFDPRLRPLFDLQLKVTAGELSDRISLFWGLITFHWNVHGGFYWLGGGTSILPQVLAARLGHRLLLQSRALSVSDGSVPRVGFIANGSKQEVEAKAVILATPPRNAIEIIEGLAPWKLEALRSVRFGAYVPVHLRCQRRFWEAKIRTGYLNCSGVVFADLVDATRGQPGEEGILICFIAGQEARRLLEASDEHIFAEVVRDIEKVFPGSTAEVIEYRVFRWPDGIPYFPPNIGSKLEQIRSPQGNLFFCGDYTQGAGINDAVISGQLAAREVQEFLRAGRKLSNQPID